MYTIFRLIWNSKRTLSVWFQINRCMVNTIWLRFGLIIFGKYFSACVLQSFVPGRIIKGTPLLQELRERNFRLLSKWTNMMVWRMFFLFSNQSVGISRNGMEFQNIHQRNGMVNVLKPIYGIFEQSILDLLWRNIWICSNQTKF